MRASTWGWMVLALAAVAPGARATSLISHPPLVERLAQWPELNAAGWDIPRNFPVVVETYGWDAKGRRPTASGSHRLSAEETALLEALVEAQRTNDREPFARALRHPFAWLRDQALAALPHGRIASGYETAYMPMEAARREEVRFVLDFLPELRRLAVSVPPTANAFQQEATPVLATKVLLLLAHHVEGDVRDEVLDAAIDGIVAYPHWRALTELRSLFEERPEVRLSSNARERLLPVLRMQIGAEGSGEHDAAICLGHLRDVQGLDRVVDRWRGTRHPWFLMALVSGGHPAARDATVADLRRALRPGEPAAGYYGPPAPLPPPQRHGLQAAAMLADPTLLPHVVQRLRDDPSAIHAVIEALEAIDTPEARDALWNVLREDWVRVGREYFVYLTAAALLRVDARLATVLRERGSKSSRPMARLAVAQALAETGHDTTPIEVTAFGASVPWHVQGHSIGVFSALLAQVARGDEKATAALIGLLSEKQAAARDDRRLAATLRHAMGQMTTLERLPPTLEAWLLEARPPHALDLLARAGDPDQAMALLAPLCTYASSEYARIQAREAYGIAERRAASR